MSTESILVPRAEMDSAWKQILDAYFQEFMLFFYPTLAQVVDWSIPYEVMDKELQAITKDAMVGKQFVDKLIKVKSKEGQEQFVLVHVEVQGEPQTNFPLRLYQYHYRLFDRYPIPVVTLAVLVDHHKNWRPTHYTNTVWGQEIIRFNFSTTKLLDYAENRTTLEQTDNPFGIVTLAQLAAAETRKNAQERYQIKFALTRRLYDKGLGRDAILNLYRFMDWVLSLPEDLEIRYNESIKQLEEEKSMEYITSAERIGMKKGYEQGLLQGEHKLLIRQLKKKFPTISDAYLKQVEQEQDESKLCAWGDELVTAKTVEEVFDESE